MTIARNPRRRSLSQWRRLMADYEASGQRQQAFCCDRDVEVSALREQLAEVQRQLAWFQRQLFGRKSEKLHPLAGSGQGELLAGLAEAPEGAVLAMDETPIKAGRKAKGQMRQAYSWPVYG